MDLAIRELSLKLINEINKADLPMEVKRLIVKDIYGQLEKTTESVIMKAIQERNEQAKVEQNKEKTDEQGEIE